MPIISVTLSDLNEAPLRHIAGELAIPDVAGKNKDELVAAIKEKLSPDSPLALTTFSQPPLPKWYMTPTVIISLVALIVSVGGFVVSAWSNVASVGKISYELAREREKDEANKREEWKTFKVYDIIFRHTFNPERWTGLDFEELRTKYTQEVVSEQDVSLGRADLQPDELRRILMKLRFNYLIEATVDDKYAIARVLITSRECAQRPTTEAIERALLKLLSTESGKYTRDKLMSKVSEENKFKSEDVYTTANCMRAAGKISIDEVGKVWSTLETQEPKIQLMDKVVPKPMDPPLPRDPKKPVEDPKKNGC